MSTERMYWNIMTYRCDHCGYTLLFYLEDGCEGPRDKEAGIPKEWAKRRAQAPASVRATLPPTAPQTNSGRYVLPVPFIATGCPNCQGPPPWKFDGGVLQHADFQRDVTLQEMIPESRVPKDSGLFRYPDRPLEYQACGHPVLPAERRSN